MIPKCSKLKKLNIGGCKHLGYLSLIEIANSCPELEFLDISGGVKVTDEALIEIGYKCTKLIHLDISDNDKVTKELIFEFIGCAQNVKSIFVLGCNQLSGLRELCSRFPPPELSQIAKILVWGLY